MTDNANAKAFRQLHAGPDLLLLANCWDVASARLVENLGARALATTSAGVCWSHGYPDGDALPIDVLIASVRAITRVAKLPLSVDIEGGYSGDPETVAETVAALIDAGAVGINLEDGAAPPELLESKIERIKQRAARAGVDVFVNARTDVYLRGLVPEPARVEESVARGRRYRDAGADGLFVPKVIDPGEIRSIAAAVSELPLNVLAWPKLPPASELPALGVRRLSAGSALAQLAYGRLNAAAGAFLREGRSEPLADGATTFAQMNPLFPR
jgi:2-methylisocitrate lyase-like PEP mutase family enzyme